MQPIKGGKALEVEMSNESAFHDGYKKAMEEAAALVERLAPDSGNELSAELERRIERARCLSRASLAAQSAGHQGY
ncbi:MAG: hypothetical protein ACYTGN_13950 [Planctomycetota bacterium]